MSGALDKTMADDSAGRVVVGVHDSLAGLHALRYAIAEARRRGAVLLAVRTWLFDGWQDPGLLGVEAAFPDFTRQAHIHRARWIAEEAFAAACGGIPPDVEVRLLVEQGATATVLVRIADREDDLLIVGGRGRPTISNSWTATVARLCVRRARCPVLVVPAPAAARISSRELRRHAQRFADSVSAAGAACGPARQPRA